MYTIIVIFKIMLNDIYDFQDSSETQDRIKMCELATSNIPNLVLVSNDIYSIDDFKLCVMLQQ